MMTDALLDINPFALCGIHSSPQLIWRFSDWTIGVLFNPLPCVPGVHIITTWPWQCRSQRTSRTPPPSYRLSLGQKRTRGSLGSQIRGSPCHWWEWQHAPSTEVLNCVFWLLLGKKFIEKSLHRCPVMLPPSYEASPQLDWFSLILSKVLNSALFYLTRTFSKHYARYSAL
jgi:hypothetical protein